MLDKNKLESDATVEQRARQNLKAGAVIKSALLAGALVYVIPSGGPWMSNESFTNVMGRVISMSVAVDLIGHFGLALLYGWIIAVSIYRPPTGLGIAIGTAFSLPLWGVNYVMLAVGGGFHGNELHTFLAHFEFCLFFSVAYRAMAVPRPRRIA